MAQEPITGLFQWLHWGTVSANGTMGVVTGGALPTDPDARIRSGIGGNTLRRGGIIKATGNASFYVTSSNQALVAAALRASYPRGALTPVYLAGGADDWGLQWDAAKVTDCRIDYSQGEGLRATITWGGIVVATAAGDAMDPEANLDLEDYEAVITVEGVEYGVTDMGIAIANNTNFSSSANTKVAGVKRQANTYRYGLEMLTMELTTDEPVPMTTLDYLEDTLPNNIGAVMAATNGVDTLTATLINLQPSSQEFGLVDANSAAPWKYGFNGDPQGGSLTWTWA